ncbi:MAG: hypothetical protein ACD_75C00015G0001 [uncultured bacterium]|nr:MAG: hypothetical protein ACD_75C00015G0001 [uncultured bacterium]
MEHDDSLRVGNEYRLGHAAENGLQPALGFINSLQTPVFFFPQLFRLGPHGQLVDGPVDHYPDIIRGERLADKIECALLHGGYRLGNRGKSGNDDNLYMGLILPNPVKDRKTVKTGHHQVGQDDIEVYRLEHRKPPVAVLRFGDFVPSFRQGALHPFPDNLFIVYDQNTYVIHNNIPGI